MLKLNDKKKKQSKAAAAVAAKDEKVTTKVTASEESVEKEKEAVPSTKSGIKAGKSNKDGKEAYGPVDLPKEAPSLLKQNKQDITVTVENKGSQLKDGQMPVMQAAALMARALVRRLRYKADKLICLRALIHVNSMLETKKLSSGNAEKEIQTFIGWLIRYENDVGVGTSEEDIWLSVKLILQQFFTPLEFKE